MFAVVRTGGKQLRVEPGAAVRVEKLEGSVGDSIELGEVLLVGTDQVGTALRQRIRAGRGPKSADQP